MLNILFISITLLYFILIISFVYGFNKVKAFRARNIDAEIKFSIVIPFRNEAKNLPNLLHSLLSLNYDYNKFEILLVDDESKDQSVEIITNRISSFHNNIQIIKNKRETNSPKKDAITSAIAIAKYEWIVTTDADCIVPKHWLHTFNAFIIQEKPEMLVAPVTYHKTDSFLKRFQLLDFLSLIGATIGGFGINKPFLCNGANLVYKKELFKTINGFEGNTNIASGDDIFMLEKALKKNSKNVCYLKSKDATVKTLAQPSWALLIEQRKRWAAKTSHYQSRFGKLTGLLVLLMNSVLIISVFLSIIDYIAWKVSGVIFLLKMASDFLLLYRTSRFFNQQKHLVAFLISFIIYPFFSVYIAFTSLFTSYKWKERAFKT